LWHWRLTCDSFCKPCFVDYLFWRNLIRHSFVNKTENTDVHCCLFQIEWDLSNSELAILIKWSYVEFMGGNWPNWYSTKFTGISKQEINCILPFYGKKLSSRVCLHGNQEKTSNANNFGAKIFHSKFETDSRFVTEGS